ncbi:MAG: hypothetical protein HYY01_01750 [Chloroflexi bacterium]|nr:hypothetical protein [Chloroflexota bacterium]
MRLTRMPQVLLALLVVVGLVAAACKEGPATPALLPAGMASAPVPETEVDAYLYMDQGEPTTFVKGIADLPVDLSVDAASFWFGKTEGGEFNGVVFDFTSAAEAQAAFDLLPPTPDRWKHVAGTRLSLVTGSDEATRAIRESIEAGNWKELSVRYPDMWDKLNRALPDQPPAPPRGAGFFLTKDWLDWTAKQTGNPGLENAAPMAKGAGLKGGVFAAYSREPVRPPQKAETDFFKQSGMSALVVVQSSYPGFLFSTLFNNVASRYGGLKEVDLDGEKALRLDGPDMDMTALLKTRGNLLYLAAAGEEGMAKDLLRSAIAQ